MKKNEEGHMREKFYRQDENHKLELQRTKRKKNKKER